MHSLIANVVSVDVTDDESIYFYTVVTFSLLVLSIMIDESKTFNWYFFSLLFCKKVNSGKYFFINICIKRTYFIQLLNAYHNQLFRFSTNGFNYNLSSIYWSEQDTAYLKLSAQFIKVNLSANFCVFLVTYRVNCQLLVIEIHGNSD